MSVNDLVLLAILAIVVVTQAIESHRVTKILWRHQKALEWFRRNVHLIESEMPEDAPEEIWDLVEGKERKTP